MSPTWKEVLLCPAARESADDPGKYLTEANHTSTGSVGVTVPDGAPAVPPGGALGVRRGAQSNALFGVPASSRTTRIISFGSKGLVR